MFSAPVIICITSALLPRSDLVVELTCFIRTFPRCPYSLELKKRSEALIWHQDSLQSDDGENRLLDHLDFHSLDCRFPSHVDFHWNQSQNHVDFLNTLRLLVREGVLSM